MQRRTFLAGLAPIILRSQPASRPNFLFLLADDHAADVMGWDGNALARTPSLDRLAREGTYFASAYCNSPVCTPSRQSLLTGTMPHTAGVTVLTTPFSPSKPTLSRALKEAGYHTGVFGKMHWNQTGKPGLFGFDEVMADGIVGQAWQKKVQPKPIPPEIPTQKLPWQPFKTHAREWLNAACLPYPARDEEMRGTFIARRAIEFLRRHRRDPFALWVSFNEPHSPFDFPIEDRGTFSPSRFTPPRVGPEDAQQIPLIFRDLTDEEKRGIIAAYYTSTHFMDRNCGRVLNALDELGLASNTLVVYVGDNGYMLGHHGRFEKHCGYEPALRIPLIFRWPGRIAPGQVVRDLVELIDVAPTVLGLLGAPPLEGAQGISLRPYLEGRRPPKPRDHIVSEYLENEEVYVRTARWKLIFGSGKRARKDGYETDNPTPGRYVRLYDLKADPGEFTSVADRNRGVVQELLRLALARFRATHPDAQREPRGLSIEEAMEFYLPPRDGA